MVIINKLSKTAVSVAVIFSTSLAFADDNCTKPKLAGYSPDDMSCIGDGLINVWNEQGEKVVNQSGKTIIPAGRYQYIFGASNGLIGVGRDSDTYTMVGFVSQATGKEVIPLRYVSTGEYDVGVNNFSEGLVALKNPAEKWGFLNAQGKTVIPFIYDNANDFSEGLSAVLKGGFDEGKYGFIDKTGKTTIPFIYDSAGNFSEGLATVGKGQYENAKYGVIDKSGKTVVPFQYRGWIGEFSEGMAVVIGDNDTYGYINRVGKLVIPYNYVIESYEGALPSFHNGKTHVTDKQGNYYCINKTGKKVTC